MYTAHQNRPYPGMPPPLATDDRYSSQPRASYATTPASATLPRPGKTDTALSVPPPFSGEVDGRIYSLEVVQEPQRARMCGFGDKDRRPITPPPCIRLVVRDATTKQEVDINEIDTSYFVLTVDLWDVHGQKEVNLVRHSATSPSISAATSSSYPPPSTPTFFPHGMPMTQVHYGLINHHSQNQGQGAPSSYYGNGTPTTAYPGSYADPHSAVGPPQPQSYYTTQAGTPLAPTAAGYYAGGQGPLYGPQQPMDPRSAPSGMFTRNLIGSLCVSASKLSDPTQKLGVWFVLQDLSVRTEGSFRLKMNFVNVGNPTQPATLNAGSAPILASCFSKDFTVYSAKKFPGVIESTQLSKCFATQGIKIPIRKDGPGRGGDDDE